MAAGRGGIFASISIYLPAPARIRRSFVYMAALGCTAPKDNMKAGAPGLQIKAMLWSPRATASQTR